MKWYCLSISIVLFISGCGQMTFGKTNTPAYSPVVTKITTLPIRLTETPTLLPLSVTSASMPFCEVNDLYLEVDTMHSPPPGSAIIRIVLYTQKEDYACRVETLVNFKLVSENGELLPIEGNNGLAFSKGYTLTKHDSYIYGVGAVWYWHNYCQKGKTNIVLLGSAAGLQLEKPVSVVPSCFNDRIGSYIDPYSVNISDQQTVEWLGTATPSP